MGDKPTTIEINGRKYNARTGEPMSGSHANKPAARPVMDVAAKRTAPSRAVHKSPGRSRTLMRHGVKRPHNLKPAINKPVVARAVDDFAAPAVTAATRPQFVSKADDARLHRAHKVKQSRLVSRFHNSALALSSPLTPTIQPLAVHPAPATPAALSLPVKPHSEVDSLIAKGLKNAKSHTEIPKKHTRRSKRRGRLASAAAGTMAILLLGGFFAYQSVPNISMRYASSRAGVQAQLPSYQPAGFSLDRRISYSPGQVTLDFRSNTDERNFSITQRQTNWNSETLRQNYVANASTQVNSFEDKGQTIFIYDGSSATWVSRGVWYEIKGDSSLSSDQLIRIATSM